MRSRMRNAAILLILLITFSLFTGCVSLGPPPSGNQGSQVTPKGTSTPKGGSPVEGSIQDITSRNAPRVSLADVIGALPTAGQEAGIDTTGMVITKVWGYGVDSAGLAKTWVLGLHGGSTATLIAATEGEYKTLDLPTSLPQDEMKLGELVSPQDLFNRNLNTIVGEMNLLRVGECDLTLDAGTYQIIIHSATDSSTLTFNAKTGELIANP